MCAGPDPAGNSLLAERPGEHPHRQRRLPGQALSALAKASPEERLGIYRDALRTHGLLEPARPR